MSFVRNFCVESNEFQVSISAKGVIKLSEWSVKSMSAILMGEVWSYLDGEYVWQVDGEHCRCRFRLQV